MEVNAHSKNILFIIRTRFKFEGIPPSPFKKSTILSIRRPFISTLFEKKKRIAITKRVYYFFILFFTLLTCLWSETVDNWPHTISMISTYSQYIFLTSFLDFFLGGGSKQQQNTKGYQLVITIVLFIALTAANHVQNVRDPLPVVELCRIR